MDLIVFSGIPGSGKTTLAKKMAQEYNAIIYSYDELKMGKSYLELKNIRQQMMEEVSKSLKSYNVIVDDLNVSKKARIALLQYAKNASNKKCIVMTTSLEECLKRDAKREFPLQKHTLESIAKHYQLPTLDEGWDEILYY